MKKISILWTAPAILISFYAIQIHINQNDLKNDVKNTNDEVQEYATLKKNYELFSATILNDLKYINDDIFKQQIDTISKSSKVNIVEFRYSEPEHMCREITMQVRTTYEKNCYKFLHLLENNINGVFKCNAISLKRDNNLIVLKLKANIFYCNLRHDSIHKKHIINENYNFELLRTKKIHILHGIVGPSALINNQIVKVGDVIDEKTIESINNQFVTLKTRNCTRKSIALGQSF